MSSPDDIIVDELKALFLIARFAESELTQDEKISSPLLTPGLFVQ